LSQGKRTAIASATGVAVGDFIAMSASLAGLGALVLTSATLFILLKWVGAVYLVWLGIKLLRSAPTEGLEAQATPDSTARQVFGHAALVTALNPKSIAFFIAFVPQFVTVDAPLLPQFAILIATFVGLAAINALAYALAADKLRQTIRRPIVLTWLTRMGGAALVGMGLLTATLRRAT
jgi:threonine/homoserine/homoserine lactone efflux protein